MDDEPIVKSNETRILLLVPTARDAEVTRSHLQAAGLECAACGDLVALVRESSDGVAAILLTEEVLSDRRLDLLIQSLQKQPDWSDLPIVLLVRAAILSVATNEAIRLLGNVTILERPAALRTVASAMKAAVRSRMRQYQIRHQIEQLRAAAEEKRALLDREQAARSEAERAGRVKDEFLATLSHELRTPLNAILGWTQILADNTDPETVSEGLKVIERNARVQTQIISDLLDMSRIVSGKVRLEVKRIDPAEVLRAAIDAVRPGAAAKGIQIRLSEDSDGASITGDPGRLQQVFWNLLSNAIKFTPRSGAVDVKLAKSDGHVEVTVADTGEGIKPEFLPHVFERFRQADASTTRRHGGLGLGLSIVKQLIEMHGGHVRADSAGQGKGATFIVDLPVQSKAVAAGENGAPDSVEEHLHSTIECDDFDLKDVRILVVDDDPDARRLLKMILEGCEAVVSVADSASQGLEQVHAFHPEIIVSDIGMPNRDGYEFLADVRAIGIHTPAIALTAFARAEDRARSLKAGYEAHINKPIEPAKLISTIYRIVRHVKVPN